MIDREDRAPPGAPARRVEHVGMLLVFLTLAALSPADTVTAQAGPLSSDGTVRVGVIVSRSGVARAAGASQALAATAWEDASRRSGGVFGVTVLVTVEDDGGVPATAASLAQGLVGRGVHAIVCCSTAAATRAVAQVAEAEGVLLLAATELAGLGSTRAAGYWSFALWPDDTDGLSATVADVLRGGRGSAALMTLDNDFGTGAETALASLLRYAGLADSGVVHYAPGTGELRPEALLTASRLPGAVIVWGLADDLQVAVRALRARGYEGPTYGRGGLLAPGTGAQAGGGLGLAALVDVRFAVPPALAPDALPADYACADAVARVRRDLAAAYGGVIDLAAAAPVVDALDLVARGVEQLLALQLPPVPVASERQALRDAVVALPETCGAGGLLDLEEGRRSAVVPRGLVTVQVAPYGGLRPSGAY